MIINTTRKILSTGIHKYANIFDTEPVKTQILIKIENDKLIYKMCKDFQPIIDVTFREIMDKKIDILQYESIAGPFLKKSIEKFATENNTSTADATGFIYYHNATLAIAFYEDINCKKVVTLENHFKEMGIPV